MAALRNPMDRTTKQLNDLWATALENLWRRFEALTENDRTLLEAAQQQFDETGKISLTNQATLNWVIGS